ncbi:MAG TPA: HAMP domain-containing sensor histidine kinase [Thermoanaerobaculaceae bacterium]|nr:HAMP domain-containing sensor histidine kinase [Thermoanaerobaculaceae bacterium]
MSRVDSPSNALGLPLMRTHEVLASGRWLLTVRWLAGGGVLAATWLAHRLLLPRLDTSPLYAVGATILLYNAVLWGWLGRMPGDPVARLATYRRLTHLQVGLDWLATLALIHFSGGVESPLVFAFVFHIVVVSLLFERNTALAYAAAGLLLSSGLVLFEAAGLVGHRHVAGLMPGESFADPAFIVAILATFALINAVTAFLATSIAEHVRRREDQLAALYAGMQAINSTLEFRDVLDGLVRATVEVMGVQGASIGLLDSTGTKIESAASHGLSEAYLNKGPVLVSLSPVHDHVLSSGETATIQSDEDRARLQYPAAAEAENIRSMLFVPLKGKDRTFGVVRAYSSRADAFGPDDARFLEAIAAQGAIAIENAMSYQALRQLDLEKSRFTRMVTHELRAPIHGAQSLLSLVLDGYAGTLDPKQAGFLSRLKRRLQTLQLLIDDLLDHAAGRSGLDVEEVASLPLLEVLREVVAQHEQQALQKRLDVRLEPAAEAPGFLVRATPQGLARIFSNLVGNAVKYTPDGGSVRVSLQRLDDTASVRVADTGIGIPAQSMQQLFTEFYRAPNAKSAAIGTGLGLVIVKELVERFGGRVSVESQEGAGTTFTVLLPLAAEA